MGESLNGMPGNLIARRQRRAETVATRHGGLAHRSSAVVTSTPRVDTGGSA
jgi:hypothetical protein